MRDGGGVGWRFRRDRAWHIQRLSSMIGIIVIRK